MKNSLWLTQSAALIVLALLLDGRPVCAEDRQVASEGERPSERKIAEIREQAKLLHKVYAASLEMLHERYFKGDKASVPARALEDVFREIAHETQIKARWIGVNARVLGLNHEPQDEFEKQAAAALGSGKGSYEAVEMGRLRRAEAIGLRSSCLVCHGTLGIEPKTPRYAGLVIEIPLKKAE